MSAAAIHLDVVRGLGKSFKSAFLKSIGRFPRRIFFFPFPARKVFSLERFFALWGLSFFPRITAYSFFFRDLA